VFLYRFSPSNNSEKYFLQKKFFRRKASGYPFKEYEILWSISPTFNDQLLPQFSCTPKKMNLNLSKEKVLA
jgi:hypothetical protein